MFKHLSRLFGSWVSSVLILIFLIPTTWAEEKVRVRDINCADAIYLSSTSDPLRGEKIADLNPESIQRAFEEDPSRFESEVVAFDIETGRRLTHEEVEAAEEGTYRTTQDRKILYAVLPELWGETKSEVFETLRSAMAQANLKSEPKLRSIGRPGGKSKVLQSFIYPAPLPQDMVPISRSEVVHGVQSVLISAGAGLTIQLLAQLNEVGWEMALAIVIPAWFVNTIQSGMMSLPRNTWGNYFRRSEKIARAWLSRAIGTSPYARKIQRVVGSIAQQIWLTIFFTFNVYWAGQGSPEASARVFTHEGLKEFANTKMGSMILNIFWRTPVEQSLADYIGKEADAGRPSEGVANSAKLRKIITIIATNLWIYSTITTVSLFQWGGRDWNYGHIGMAIVGLLGIAAWIAPQHFYKPLARSYDFVAGKVRRTSRRIWNMMRLRPINEGIKQKYKNELTKP